MSLAVTAVVLSGCNRSTDSEPSAYQAWADKVATIPLAPAEGPDAANHSAPVELALAEAPEETRNTSMKVEIVSPHQLWDIRNGPIKLPSVEVNEATVALTPAPPAPTPRPAAPAIQPVNNAGSTQLVQLGAYSSQASAEAAWSRLSSGQHGTVLNGLRPRYDPVQTQDRTLIRLRVQASTQQAQQLCHTLAANDPWCRKPSS